MNIGTYAISSGSRQKVTTIYKMSVIIKKTKKKPSLLGFLMYDIEKGLRAVYQKAILTIIFSM